MRVVPRRGVVCLQGGGEFSHGCREMDRLLLQHAPGPVAVVALAAASGRDYATANANGVRHFRALGAEAGGVLDPREHPEAAREQVAAAGLVVLPGGSPARLLDGLRSTGVGDLLVELVAGGRAVMGASAGAMVLCEWLLLPERGLALTEGLGVVAGLLVVPHWSGSRPDWVDAAASSAATVVGIPEESGLLLHGGEIRAEGQHSTRFVRERQDLPPGVSSGMLGADVTREQEGPW